MRRSRDAKLDVRRDQIALSLSRERIPNLIVCDSHRHARACRGHPSTEAACWDGRVNPDHDGGGRWVTIFESWYNKTILPGGLESKRALSVVRIHRASRLALSSDHAQLPRRRGFARPRVHFGLGLA
jgi:hypothetical protein